MRVVIQPCSRTVPVGLPGADEVRVWVVPSGRLPCDPAELAACLTPDERDRAERYRGTRVREQFVACRGLLRRVLGGCLGVDPRLVPITYTGAGKPVLADPVVHFNLTHTDGLALIAVGPRRLGVDVERVRAVTGVEGLVERFFSPAEREVFRRLPAADRLAGFLRGWTCKEAVLKAVGSGVLALDTFDVEMDPSRPPAVHAVRDPGLAGTAWGLGAWEAAPGYAAAVAVEGADPLEVVSGGVVSGRKP
jgi:4'-phosphopantetheinyl transferase